MHHGIEALRRGGGFPHSGFSLLAETGLLVRNWNVLARGALVLRAQEIGNLLILGLLHGTFVVLWALPEELLLHIIHPYRHAICLSVTGRRGGGRRGERKREKGGAEGWEDGTLV